MYRKEGTQEEAAQVGERHSTKRKREDGIAMKRRRSTRKGKWRMGDERQRTENNQPGNDS